MSDLKAGRELDREIAEKVFGCAIEVYDQNKAAPYEIWRAQSGIPQAVRPFSGDIAAAWEVAERIAGIGDEISVRLTHSGVEVEIRRFHPDDTWAGGGYFCTGDEVKVTAETAPLAICLAALAAVSSTPEPSVTRNDAL